VVSHTVYYHHPIDIVVLRGVCHRSIACHLSPSVSGVKKNNDDASTHMLSTSMSPTMGVVGLTLTLIIQHPYWDQCYGSVWVTLVWCGVGLH